MIYNINDKLRKLISNKSVVDLIDLYNSDKKEKKNIFIKLMILDYYKFNYFYFNESKYDINYMESLVKNDFGMFLDLINIVEQFTEMDFLSKCLLFEKIEYNNQDEKLIEFSKLHLLDKFTYKIVNDLDYYKEYYKDYINKNKTKLFRREEATDILSNEIIKLKNNNINLYKKQLLEIIKEYYKWKNYIKSNNLNNLLTKEDIIYLKKIDRLTIEELYEEIECNYQFLLIIVGEYLHYQTEEIEIDKEEVNNYFNNSSEKIKKKLG